MEHVKDINITDRVACSLYQPGKDMETCRVYTYMPKRKNEVRGEINLNILGWSEKRQQWLRSFFSKYLEVGAPEDQCYDGWWNTGVTIEIGKLIRRGFASPDENWKTPTSPLDNRGGVMRRSHKRSHKEDRDLNFQKYRELKSDPVWLKNHEGLYVAIVGGEVVGVGEDRTGLLAKIRKGYPNRPKFFTEVRRKPRVIDFPSSHRVH